MHYIIYNPLSKSGNNPKVIKKVQNYLDKKGLEHELLDVLDVSQKKEEFVEKIHRTDTLILVGGDGTLHYFSDGIKDIQTNGLKMYFYRGGTGNDFGRKFKDRFIDITEIVKDLPSYNISGKEELFLNCTGFGIDGAVCNMIDGNTKSKKGLNYFKSAIHLFKNFKPFDLEVEVDGVLHRYKNVWFSTVMNGKFFGGGMMLNPKGNRFDQEMELYVIHTVKLAKLLLIFPLIFIGKHLAFRKVGIDVVKGKEFRLKASRPQIFESDGEVKLDVQEMIVKR